MKRYLIVGVVLLLVVVLLVPLAFSEDAPTGVLSDEQKAKITDLRLKMLQLRKEMIDIYAQAGFISPQQAEYMKKRLDLQAEYLESYEGQPWPGYAGPWGGPGRMGRGFNRGMGAYGCPGMGWGW